MPLEGTLRAFEHRSPLSLSLLCSVLCVEILPPTATTEYGTGIYRYIYIYICAGVDDDGIRVSVTEAGDGWRIC